MKKYLLGLLLFFVSCGISKTYLYELDFTEDKDRKSGNIFNVFVHDKKEGMGAFLEKRKADLTDF